MSPSAHVSETALDAGIATKEGDKSAEEGVPAPLGDRRLSRNGDFVSPVPPPRTNSGSHGFPEGPPPDGQQRHSSEASYDSAANLLPFPRTQSDSSFASSHEGAVRSPSTYEDSSALQAKMYDEAKAFRLSQASSDGAEDAYLAIQDAAADFTEAGDAGYSGFAVLDADGSSQEPDYDQIDEFLEPETGHPGAEHLDANGGSQEPDYDQIDDFTETETGHTDGKHRGAVGSNQDSLDGFNEAGNTSGGDPITGASNENPMSPNSNDAQLLTFLGERGLLDTCKAMLAEHEVDSLESLRELTEQDMLGMGLEADAIAKLQPRESEYDVLENLGAALDGTAPDQAARPYAVLAPGVQLAYEQRDGAAGECGRIICCC